MIPPEVLPLNGPDEEPVTTVELDEVFSVLVILDSVLTSFFSFSSVKDETVTAVIFSANAFVTELLLSSVLVFSTGFCDGSDDISSSEK